MTAIASLVNWFNTSRIDQIDQFRREPFRFQARTFKNLLAKASNTEWGRKYGYSSIGSFKEYQSRVPVQTYEDIIPYVERLRKGEENLLWPGEIRWFTRSSGTTSTKSKFIPVSRESLEECHYRAIKDILAIYLHNNPSSRIFSGKALTLGGSHKINKFSNNSLFGDLSAILIENAPAAVEMIRTPKKRIALIEDFEKKLELITVESVKENVTSFSGVPSWYLTLIKAVLSHTGKRNLLEVWPNLEIFFHGGVSFIPYQEIYRKLIPGDQMHYMETYNASEGFFGIQDDLNNTDLLLMPDYGIFYEFVPAENINTDSPVAYTLDEIETGKNYALVISTSGGLWRYLLGDTVKFSCLAPNKFKITGRTKHYINTFGEEVIIDNAEKALESACRATGAIINEYSAGPIFMGETSRGSHEWLIEFEKEPVDLYRFTLVLDETLQSINSDYEAKRFKDINLVRPKVRIVPYGTFNKWLKAKNKLGGQNKVPRLSNNREYLDELYTIAGLNRD